MALDKESSQRVAAILGFKKEELLALATQPKSQLDLVRALRTKYKLTPQEADMLRQELVRLKHTSAEIEL